jgi:integrase
MRLYKQPGSAKWWCDFTTTKGKRIRRSTKMTDKHAAEVRAADMMREEEREETGLSVHRDTRKAGPPALIDEFEIHLRRKGRTAKHIGMTVRTLHRLLDPLVSIESVTPERLEAALDEIRASRSDRTVNQFRWCLKTFFRWLKTFGKWSEDPSERIAPQREIRTLRRRALTPDEIARLLDAAPPGRALVYRMAITTGLRRGELAALRWGDLSLDDRKTVTVRQESAKNRREDTLPLQAGTAAALLAARGEAEDAERVFRSVPNMTTFRKDLEAAGIAFETPEGRVDFHALRVTFGTALARAGVHLVTAQNLMRHCDPKLTATIYTRLRLDDTRGAVAKIDLGSGSAAEPTMPPTMPQASHNGAEPYATARNAEAREERPQCGFLGLQRPSVGRLGWHAREESNLRPSD